MDNKLKVPFNENITLDELESMSKSELYSFIDTVIKFYDSDEYKDYYYDQHWEPPTYAYDAIFEYGVKHGIAVDVNKNIMEYDIPEETYDIDGNFVIGRLYGQGDVLYAYKVGKDDVVPHEFEEDYVAVYNPKNELICKTRNVATFDDIRVQIKRKHLNGYYVIYNQVMFNIDSNGTVDERTHCFNFGQIHVDILCDLV